MVARIKNIWQPLNVELVPEDELPSDWPSFAYRGRVSAGGVPSGIVVDRVKKVARVPAVSIWLRAES